MEFSDKLLDSLRAMLSGFAKASTEKDKETMQAILDQFLKDFSSEDLLAKVYTYDNPLVVALYNNNLRAAITMLKKAQDKDLYALLGYAYSEILAELSNLEERASDQDKKILQSIKGRLLAKPIK